MNSSLHVTTDECPSSERFESTQELTVEESVVQTTPSDITISQDTSRDPTNSSPDVFLSNTTSIPFASELPLSPSTPFSFSRREETSGVKVFSSMSVDIMLLLVVSDHVSGCKRSESLVRVDLPLQIRQLTSKMWSPWRSVVSMRPGRRSNGLTYRRQKL